MPDINPSIPIPGQPNASEEPKIPTALSQIVATLNNLDDDNIAAAGLSAESLTSAVSAALGLNQNGAIRRGKSIIATSETRTNAAYGLMPTPDRVQNIVLPTDGLIYVAYQATWQESGSGAAAADIFIGGNQLKVTSDPAPAPLPATIGIANIFKSLATGSQGLQSNGGAVPFTGDVTTGQVVGDAATTDMGACVIFAAAGTYDISVQYRANSGQTVTTKNRKLWVWTMGF
jgi:hypothetical protein